ncbi:CHY zinc finger protein [Halorubrum lipolyticum]|uniref:Zinc finger CHY domain protein n=1 Tax=Halorubrum lipolyticum DSM 21995 TaxID=1227482 RepID=M0P542_9EURY|nr:CHY zinc finger protein [Halorubrum lipolyticum]EMA64649.1 zinc finger CHY domain protein [Halorubrum lipolyticum DSM 21995]
MATPPTDDRRTTTAPATDDRFAVPLRGVAVDPETRCAHWDTAVDVVALRLSCCETYYPCDACHDAVTGHAAEPWPRDRFDEPAALCGACGATLSAREYLDGDSEGPSPSDSEGPSPSGNRASPGDSRTQSGDSEAQRAAGSRAKPDDACPRCDAGFNPGCRAHRDRYFEV